MSYQAKEFGAIMDVPAGGMSNPHYGLVIYPFMCGQFRLQLTDKRKTDFQAPEGHGQIVREMCTYSRAKAGLIAAIIHIRAEPEAYCESLANAQNCEAPGGRIRLDNE